MNEPNQPTRHAFPATPWSLVGRAARGTHTDECAALSELLRRYLPALRAHLVHYRRLSPDEADELLQAFLADKVLEARLLRRADAERGRFRTFLLTALQRFLIDHRRARQSRQKHVAEAGPEADAEWADGDAAGPEAHFDRAWARRVLESAAARMRAECQTSARDDVWGVFEHRVYRPSFDGSAAMPYDELISTYRLRSAMHASNLLMTGKRMYERHLRAIIAEYAESDEEIDGEIRDLHAVFDSRGGSP
jgi:DNA-directed RNA polymerase specialized sigma24 family protein